LLQLLLLVLLLVLLLALLAHPRPPVLGLQQQPAVLQKQQRQQEQAHQARVHQSPL
jgi:hypothetical protein